METYGSDRAHKVLEYLTGNFLFTGATEHAKGLRMILGLVLSCKAVCSSFLPKIYMNCTRLLVMGRSPQSVFRKILGGLLLPFLSFMFIVHLHIHQGVLPYLKEGQEIWTLLYLSFLVMAVINCAILLLTSAHDLNNKEDKVQLEEIIKKDPILSKKASKCPRCEIPNVLRANHCITCDMHVAKFHEHSMTLNKCIGAGNLLPYTTLQFFMFLLFAIGCITLRLDKVASYTPSKGKKMLNNLLYLIYLLLAFFKLISFLKNLACILFNITMQEYKNWPNIAYLWKSPKKEFFNPFDKGNIKNIKEEINTLINHEEKSNKASLSDSTIIEESSELRGSTENPEDPEQRDKKLLIDSANRIVNWRTEKLVNIVEVYASPMRKAFLEYFAKKNQPKKRRSDSDSDDSDEE